MNGAPPWVIRPLLPGDLPLLRPLRLEALRSHPEAFGSSFEEEQGSDLSHLIGERPNLTLGGFVGQALVGSVGLLVSSRIKQRHVGHVVAVYVAPPWRRGGLARALTDRLIVAARSEGLVVLTLSVTVGNDAARRLYLNAGFVPYGIEPRGLMIGSDLLDSELMALLLG